MATDRRGERSVVRGAAAVIGASVVIGAAMGLCSAATGLSGAAWGQPPETGKPPESVKSPEAAKAPVPAEAAAGAPAEERIGAAVTKAVELVLGMQEAGAEGDEKAEWPYEGVYRVGGQIPIGYRVGGTSICAMALLRAPGYAEDDNRKQAVARAVRFVCRAVEHPLMSADEYDGGYDVRGWGYTYGLLFLLELKAAGATPAGSEEAVEAAIKFDIDAIQKTPIGKVGGWNYARGAGKDAVSPPSPFMTGPTLQALFAARRAGYAVDEAVVKAGLASLERGRTVTGSFVYSGDAGSRRPEAVPGSVGRMMVSEATLYLAGRSDVARIRGAVDSFIVHWEWLNQRRAKPGTHAKPYMIAPYYFYYAHYYAAQAVEMLPEHERAEYRRRINELLFSVQLADGGWNDRVFPRSANYGTAMAMMAMLMPRTPAPAAWGDAGTDVKKEGEGGAK